MATQERPGSTTQEAHNGPEAAAARRAFLAKCGRLAIVTPPVVTMMLAAESRNYATALSGSGDPHGHHHHHHHHHHDHDGGDGDGDFDDRDRDDR